MKKNNATRAKRAVWALIGTACLLLMIATFRIKEANSSSVRAETVQKNQTSSTGSEMPAVGSPAITFSDKFYDVSMTDKDHIWVVGYFGAIVHSMDGGKQWFRQDSGTKKSLTGVSFINPREGVAVGDGCTIIHTGDGGKTWLKQKSPVSDRKFLHVQLLDAKESFAIGELGTILRTVDGGVTWEKLPFDEDVILNDLVFITPQEGWIAGEFETILHTTDGGKTFEKQRGDQLGEIFGITFKDNLHGAAVGTEGKTLITADGGKTWEEIKGATDDTLLKVRYAGSTLIAVGLRGSVVSSGDDGRTWTEVKIPEHYSWLSGLAVADGVGVAAGDVGKILSSNDNGKTWTQLGKGSYVSGGSRAGKE